MKLICTAIALLFSIVCMGQKPCMCFENDFATGKYLQGKVRLIRSSEEVSSNANEVMKSIFNKAEHAVDSFNDKGYEVHSYNVNGVVNYDVLTSYEYDSNGNVTKACVKYSDDTTITCEVFEYNSDGTLALYTEYRNGNPYRFTRYNYLSGQYATKIDSTPNSTDIIEWEYKCTTEMMEETIHFPNGKTAIGRKFHFDKNGNKTLEERVNTFNIFCRYDDHNSKISEEYFYPTAPNRKVYSARYTYDNQGNWISCFEEDNTGYSGRKYRLTTRQIEYY